MDYAPWARIVLRYGIGYFAGSEMGEQLTANPDLVMALSVAMGAAVEWIYVLAKNRGGKT